MGVAEAITDEEIKIAIGVGIREGRCDPEANRADPEGIGYGSSVGGSSGASCIPEKEGVAIEIADEEIKIAIAVGIREGRAGGEANIADAEGIGGASVVGESGGTRVGGVPEKEGVAEALTDEEIKIAIAVGIREGRFGEVANKAKPGSGDRGVGGSAGKQAAGGGCGVGGLDGHGDAVEADQAVVVF